jgi:hypothetical protein
MSGVIPVADAEFIGLHHEYDQVVILARRVGDNGVEQLVTWGKDDVHKAVAARIGDRLTAEVFGWSPAETVIHEDYRLGATKVRT